MGLINWIFDAYQHQRIGEAHREAAQARAEIAAIRSKGGGIDVGHLERALGELALAVKTLERLILDKGVCTEAELYDKLREIDGEDGRIDGQAPY